MPLLVLVAVGAFVLGGTYGVARLVALDPRPLTAVPLLGPVGTESVAGVVIRLSAAMRIADDCGYGHDPTSRHVHRGRQAV
ncbi:MAG: hypothetical protein QOE61_5384 [Micromonosporaceae bacterium]|nr:hypothetical protein [Micromonosporaceae bacterium]